MDYVEMVAEMYRKRIAEGENKKSARYFSFTQFQDIDFTELQKMRKHLKENGYVENSFNMGFTVTEEAAELFEE
jgi:Mn-dependent DtxR family transcriptional regulator